MFDEYYGCLDCDDGKFGTYLPTFLCNFVSQFLWQDLIHISRGILDICLFCRKKLEKCFIKCTCFFFLSCRKCVNIFALDWSLFCSVSVWFHKLVIKFNFFFNLLAIKAAANYVRTEKGSIEGNRQKWACVENINTVLGT